MYKNRIEKVLVLDDEDKLSGLVTMRDIENTAKNPDATKDDFGRLIVGAALGTDKDTFDRAEALFNEGVDVLVIDSAHGHSKNVIETIKTVKQKFPNVDVYWRQYCYCRCSYGVSQSRSRCSEGWNGSRLNLYHKNYRRYWCTTNFSNI
ncbi:MAG: hypothetical protein CM15mP127_06500 [Gammaproteobacteria bacterium]|nr:MAG: hypothetical protein CM15mP127_06500 [Gammaproteobacteria bacterium]